MRPRFFLAAQEELDHTSQALRRAYGQPEPTATRRGFRLPRIKAGQIIFAVCVILLLKAGWSTKTADPLGDARLNNARTESTPLDTAPRATLVRNGAPRAQLVQLPPISLRKDAVHIGESFWAGMPDGRWVIATYVGSAKRWEELPWTGNRIGDARFIGQHCFVWLNPIGQTSPTWIDP